MPCCIVFGIDIRGNGEGERSGEITCRLLAWLQSLIVNQGIPEGGIGEERGERERGKRSNKVVSIFMSF